MCAGHTHFGFQSYIGISGISKSQRGYPIAGADFIFYSVGIRLFVFITLIKSNYPVNKGMLDRCRHLSDITGR